ncbi:hypothetical protein ACLOJK_031565 [Asimina triloba]
MDISSSNAPNKPKFSKICKRRYICLGICAFVLFLVILFVILGFTVFKPKHAVTTVDFIRLSGMRVAFDLLRLRVEVNVTLDLGISVKNPNPVSFSFGNSTAYLYYRGGVVGEAPIPAGAISSHGTMGLNVSLAVMADRLVTDSNLLSDVRSGTLPLQTSSRIAGKVTLLNMFKHRVVSYTYCDLSIDISNRTVGESHCKYRTKI